jgi:hypothetical protein
MEPEPDRLAHRGRRNRPPHPEGPGYLDLCAAAIDAQVQNIVRTGALERLDRQLATN